MGMLVPFFDLEVLPGDNVSLAVDALYRQPSMFAPIMETLEVHHAFFYVRNDVLFDQWKSVIKPNWQANVAEEKTPTITVDFKDTLALADSELWMNTILAYMGFPVPTVTNEIKAGGVSVVINALPIAAYYKIDLDNEYSKVLKQIDDRRKSGEFDHD